MSTKSVAFALDTGDHMKVCKTDDATTARASAQQQLDLYRQATSQLGAPYYFTMGNHECLDNKNLCDTSDVVLSAFMGSLAYPTQTPYYTFDVGTPWGTATFVFVADTAWDSAQASWLQSAMAHGDSSRYTIVAKHIPSNNTTDFPTNTDEMAIIDAHRFSLLLDAHTHQFLSGAEGGREVTLGLGGAPPVNTGDDWAYGLVEQQPDASLKVTIYAATTDTPLSVLTVAPN